MEVRRGSACARACAVFAPVLLVAACSAPERVHVELAPAPDDHSVILAGELEVSPGTWTLERLRAIDLDEPEPGDLLGLRDWALSRGLRLTALYYRETLAELALERGPLEPAAEGRTRGLPAGARIDVRVLSSTTAGTWGPVASLPDALAHVRLSAETLIDRLCARPVLTPMIVHEGSQLVNSSFAIEVAGDMLVGDVEGRAWRVRPDGVVTPVTTTGTIGVAMRWPGAEGEEHLYAGRGGHVWRGRLGEDQALHLTPWADDPRAGLIRWIDGGLLDGRLELYSLSNEGIFGRWVDRTFTPLTTFEVPINRTPKGGVKWLAPGEGAAVYWASNVLARFRNGAYEAERIDATSGRVLTMIDVLPGFGLLVADEGGELFAERDGRWVDLGDWGYGEPFEINAVAPWGEGLIAAGRSGLAGQYDPRVGFCNVDNAGLSTFIRITPWGDDQLLLAEVSPRRNQIVVIRASHP